MPPLDHDRCYAAASSRDARFDGSFIVAVRTTRIYCRPSCPAITPKRANVEFHHTAAAAQQRGFRACKRCLPDATPGSPEWNTRRDVVGRAMRLIADGMVERDGVAGLARRLGYSERHLTRVVTDEVGAGPLAVARAQRAQTARILIETSTMSFTDVAFASGFGSVRQFNDTMRDVFAASPSDLRAAANRRSAPRTLEPSAVGGITLTVPARTPFAWSHLFDYFAARAIPGVEAVVAPNDAANDAESGEDVSLTRSMRCPGGPGIMAIRPNGDAAISVRLHLSEMADLAWVVHRVRRLFDLDADPVAVDAHLRQCSILRGLVDAVPGRRSPGAIDGFEMAVRAVIGQQVSVAGARTVLGGLVQATGATLPDALRGIDPRITSLFPTPEAVAAAPDEAFAMPRARRDTIRRLAAAVAAGDARLDIGANPTESRAQLCALKGIGPWTADYVLMRALSVPDVWLSTDLGVVHARRRLGIDDADANHVAQRWSPWASYATHHLWGSLATHIDNQPDPETSS